MNFVQKAKSFLLTDVAKNSAKLLSANVLVQIVGLLIYPILTRLYSPENFGLVNLFLSISGVLAIVSTAEFQYSIVLPKEDEKAVACMQLGLGVSIVLFVLLLISIPFSSAISDVFNAPALSKWYWAIPLYVFLSAVWNLLNYWCIRQKKYNDICRYQLVQSVTNAAAKCGFGYKALLQGGLILSAIISPFIALGSLVYKLTRTELHLLTSVQKSNLCSMAKEYANFPKFSLPRALLNYLSGNLPILLLTPFFGLKEIGLLGMAITAAFRPINMISNSLYQVFYEKTTEQVQKGCSIAPFFTRYFKSVLLIIVPMCVFFCFAPQLLQCLLGKEWHQTGVFVQMMSMWLLCSIMGAPISYLPDIFQKQRIGLWFEILLFIFRIIGLFIGIYCRDISMAIISYSIGSAIVIICQLQWYRSMILQYEKQRM